MAGATLEVKMRFDGSAVGDLLTRLTRAGGDAQLAFADIGEELLITHRQHFADQASPEGERWEPLSAIYRARKPKNQDRILRLDGFLEDLLRHQETATELEFGTDRIYGATHQFGDARRNIPARPYLGISTDGRDRIITILERHLRGVIDGR